MFVWPDLPSPGLLLNLLLCPKEPYMLLLSLVRLSAGDWIGTGIALAGIALAWFWPRD